jgi:disulfide bond formation protein DsbB
VTAVLAAAARAVIFGILGLAALASMLWAGLSHRGLATMAWLGVMYVTVSGCAVAWEWLGNRRRKEARR